MPLGKRWNLAEETILANAYLDGWQCIWQGAKAHLWLIPNYLEGESAIAKERFSKNYRHPVLDAPDQTALQGGSQVHCQVP
jgi:hypothetical protein